MRLADDSDDLDDPDDSDDSDSSDDPGSGSGSGNPGRFIYFLRKGFEFNNPDQILYKNV
jgi:hypothetical protein